MKTRIVVILVGSSYFWWVNDGFGQWQKKYRNDAITSLQPLLPTIAQDAQEDCNQAPFLEDVLVGAYLMRHFIRSNTVTMPRNFPKYSDDHKVTVDQVKFIFREEKKEKNPFTVFSITRNLEYAYVNSNNSPYTENDLYSEVIKNREGKVGVTREVLYFAIYELRYLLRLFPAGIQSNKVLTPVDFRATILYIYNQNAGAVLEERNQSMKTALDFSAMNMINEGLLSPLPNKLMVEPYQGAIRCDLLIGLSEVWNMAVKKKSSLK